MRTNIWLQWVCSTTSTRSAGRTLLQETTHIFRFLWSVDLGKKEKKPHGDDLDALQLNIKWNVRRSGTILWTSGESGGGGTNKNHYCWHDKSSILLFDTVLNIKVNHKNTQNICHSRLEPQWYTNILMRARLRHYECGWNKIRKRNEIMRFSRR